MRKAKLWTLVLLIVFEMQAQDLQNRILVQVALDFNQHGYIAVKSITNLKSQTPNNTNVFVGLGYRGKSKSWWLEGMLQKQWSQKVEGRLEIKTSLWAADARLVKKFGKKQKTVLYVEATPFLSQRAFGWSMYGETEVWKKIAVGTETENVNKPGLDVIALGPRMSRRLGYFAGFDVSAAGAFRFDPLQQPSKVSGHPHEIRFYLVLNRRFALTDRR